MEDFHMIKDMKVTKFDQGELFYDKKRDRFERRSKFEVEIEIFPPFKSISEKRDWFYENEDEIAVKTQFFLEDFIDKYFDSPQPVKLMEDFAPHFEKAYGFDLKHYNVKATIKEFERL